MNLGANLGATDTTLNLSNSGIQQYSSEMSMPLLLLLRRASDGAVEIVRLVQVLSAATGTIIRAQLGSTALVFTTADSASLLPIVPVQGVKPFLVGNPALGTTTAVKAAFSLTGAPQAGITAGITNPGVPRNITITGNAGGNAGNVVIHGTDFLGASISETIALSGTSTVAGNLAFATVTSIDFPTQTHGGDTVAIGVGSKLGMPEVISRATIVNVFLNNVPEVLGSWTVAVGSGVSNCTIQLSSALNGNALYVDYYVS